TRKPLNRRSARDDAASRQTKRRRDAAVSLRGDDRVEREAGTQHHLAADERSRQREREDERLNGVRRDARQRRPLARRLARSAEIERLEIPETTVNRAQMIERRAAAEIV